MIPDIAAYAKRICNGTGSSVACLVMAAIYCDRVQVNVSERFGETFLLQVGLEFQLFYVPSISPLQLAQRTNQNQCQT